MRQIDLCGSWKMRAASQAQWLSCTIPGSVCSTLLSHGKLPDPYWRDNEQKIQPVFDEDYLFSKTFSVDEAVIGCHTVELCCDGLDTIAELTLNGIQIGSADNMHRSWRFDCKQALQVGENHLEIRFRSPVGYLEAHPTSIGKRYTTIRKAACMYGWDWGLNLPDCGIWRQIRLEAYDNGRLAGVLIRQEHGAEAVQLTVTPVCDNAPEGSLVEVRLYDPQGKLMDTVRTAKNGAVKIRVENPLLWWPVGYGAQPLYRLEAELLHDGVVCDMCQRTIGLRTVILDRGAQPDGHAYRFLVNGVPIFFRGENLILPDSILSRTNSKTWQRLIRNCLKSNLNGIRVWGGAYYPPDEFYDLCDRAGLLVYQDMMFACSFYPVSPEFLDNVQSELEDNLSRIAHHPCLALLCGNNEIDGIYTVGGSREPETVALRKLFGAGEAALPEQVRRYLWSQYAPLFLELIPKMCQKWVPDLSYVPSSPSLPEPGKAESFFDYLSDGDMHYYLQYNGNAPYQKMRQMRCRFMTEIGFQSYPDMKTIRSFTEPQDRLPYTPIMYAHQKCASGNEAIELYMQRDYTVPKNFSDYVFLSQVQAGEIMRYSVEHFRRDNGYCRGVILWQLNDCWPVVSWSGIDYYGRWKALQYYIRRFYAPVLVSAEETDTCVDLWISNETPSACQGSLRWELMGPGARVLGKGAADAAAGPGESKCCVRLDFTDRINEENRSQVYLRYRYCENGRSGDGTVLFVLAKDFLFEEPAISWNVHSQETGFAVEITADKFTRCVGLETTEGDCIFSDNYFDLSPGERKVITVDSADCSGIGSAEKLASVLKVNTLNHVLLRAKEEQVGYGCDCQNEMRGALR